MLAVGLFDKKAISKPANSNAGFQKLLGIPDPA